MSLDKAIFHGKEHRKPYRGAKAIDPTCRNHGGCPACESNRMHKFEKAMPIEEKARASREGKWFYGPNGAVEGYCHRDNGTFIVAELYDAQTKQLISVSSVTNEELADCTWEE